MCDCKWRVHPHSACGGAGCHCHDEKERPTLESELSSLLNRYSAENDSRTPDFILAKHLMGCLELFNETVNHREEWHGERPASIDNNEAHLSLEAAVVLPPYSPPSIKVKSQHRPPYTQESNHAN